MQEDMNSLHENHTFELVKLPKGRIALKKKWVYKINPEENKSQRRYKASLVVKNFNYEDDIYSSCALVLGLTASLNLAIEQLDVKTDFLHGDLEEEIYMEQRTWAMYNNFLS